MKIILIITVIMVLDIIVYAIRETAQNLRMAKKLHTTSFLSIALYLTIEHSYLRDKIKQYMRLLAIMLLIVIAVGCQITKYVAVIYVF